MKTLLVVLLLEDDENDQEYITAKLRDVATVSVASDRLAFERALAKRAYDIILVDFKILGFSGSEAIALARERLPQVPIIICTGSLDDVSANAACELGAVRYFLKDRLAGLAHAVAQVCEDAQAKRKGLQNQKLELLGEISAGVVHDTNNVFSVILAGAELVRRGGTREETDRLLDRMERAAKHGAELMRQLLEFARGTDSGPFKPTTVEFIMGELGEMLRSGVFPEGIRSTVKIFPGTPKVLCDATRIHQVLLNLVFNARDAMLHGGQIDITAQGVTMRGIAGADPDKPLPLPLEGDFVRIQVRDNGPGIPSHVFPKIFDAFFTTKPQGTGMGLALVKNIVHAHKGDIEVITSDTGTTFSVYLPVANGLVKPTEFDGAGKVILLAEDDSTMRLFLTLHLESANYKVLSAVNGPEAIALFRSNPTVDLLLTDWLMPIMNGLELLENIRAFGFEVPTIVISGADTQVNLEPKPDAVISKPFSREKLLETLRDVLATYETGL